MISLRNLVEQSIQNHHSLPAIQTDKATWTYQDLGDYSIRLTSRFSEWGINPGERIGILLPKSLPFVGLIVSALKHNTPYVPLDIESPIGRLEYIIGNADCRLIITNQAMGLALQEHLDGIEKSFWFEEEGLYVILRKTQGTVVDADMAYVLYTSGSTGRPKGVMLSHQNAMCFVDWAAETFGVVEGDTVASIAPFHFDLSVYDLYVSIRQGAKLLLLRQDQCRNPMLVSQLIAENKVSCLYATPSLLQLLLRYGRLKRYDFSKLRTVLFAGEVFPIEPLRKIQTAWVDADFYNLYGPTETNVVHWHPIPRPIPEEQLHPFPIGTICPFVEARIKQQDEILAPSPGISGELLISGESVTVGYLGLAERNQIAFVDSDNKRWYKTGDLVSLDDTATLYTYKGRADRMVKRNGYRIELAEVEQALDAYPGVSSVVAISLSKAGKNLIVVFFQTEPNIEAPTLLEWKQFSTDHLPSYMVPDRFMECEEWPYTPSQKMDLQALKKRAQAYV